eukprot:365883-Chlamydomonas_euryale.AAC.6
MHRVLPCNSAGVPPPPPPSRRHRGVRRATRRAACSGFCGDGSAMPRACPLGARGRAWGSAAGAAAALEAAAVAAGARMMRLPSLNASSSAPLPRCPALERTRDPGNAEGCTPSHRHLRRGLLSIPSGWGLGMIVNA